MNIDELKNNWNSLTLPPDYTLGDEHEREICRRVESGRVTTLRDRLGRISLRLSLLCAGGILIMVPYLHETFLLAILSICFFVFMSVTHYIMYRRVCRINFYDMTVKDAIIAVSNINRDRIRQRAVGMALGIPLVCYMIFTFTSVFGHYHLYGCIAGAIVGVIIGLIINHRATMILRELRLQFE